MSISRTLACLAIATSMLGLALPATAQMPTRVGQGFSFVDKRPTFTGPQWTSAVVVSSIASEGLASIHEEIWQPGYQSTPVFHKTHVESFYVIAGQVEWTVGGEKKVLSVDDTVHVPAFTPYSAKVVGKEDAKVLRIYQPGGFDVTQAFLQSLTAAQREDKSVQELLAIASDTHEAPRNMKVAKNPISYFNLRAGRKSFDDDGTSDIALSSIDSVGRLNLQDELWKEDFFAGLHYHNTRTETFYVLGGRVEWTVGGETHALNPGDAVHIPSNVAHTVKGLDGKKAHMLMIYQAFGYDTRLEFQNRLTPEQRKDPVFQRMLRMLNDFNPARPQ